MVPAYFFGWVYKVAFISIVSIYANAAGDLAAARADSNHEILERLDKLEKLILEINKGGEG